MQYCSLLAERGRIPNAATTSGIESKAESAGVGLARSFSWPLMPLAVPLAGSPFKSADMAMMCLPAGSAVSFSCPVI